MNAMRVYTEDECGADGYPLAWHSTIKHEVRDEAGHRCVRCGHPYVVGGAGGAEWSPCDRRCTHGGPVRVLRDGEWFEVERTSFHPGAYVAPVEARWRVLTVHHLTGDKRDCRWWNLAALCQRCHLQVQGRVQMARVWPWEHTPWFRPYVAGYYAWVYLGLDVDRAEALERLEELLALERQGTLDPGSDHA